MLNAPGFTVIQTLSALAGVTAYAYFAAKGCDPLYTKEITNANQVLSEYIFVFIHALKVEETFVFISLTLLRSRPLT